MESGLEMSAVSLGRSISSVYNGTGKVASYQYIEEKI